METEAAGPDPGAEPQAGASAALAELIAQARAHFAQLRRLSRQSFPQAGTALEPFLSTVERLLDQLLRPSAEHKTAVTTQLEAAREALLHLDALMEAFSLRPR